METKKFFVKQLQLFQTKSSILYKLVHKNKKFNCGCFKEESDIITPIVTCIDYIIIEMFNCAYIEMVFVSQRIKIIKANIKLI